MPPGDGQKARGTTGPAEKFDYAKKSGRARMRPLRILTWHVHGNYLYYLSQSAHELFVPVKPGRPEGYSGRAGSLSWPDNLHEVPAEEVQSLPLDCILFQSKKNYQEDQYEILSERQRRLPKIFLEHDPPREHPTDTRHPVDDPDVLLVHVTAFNELMWNNSRTPTRVIEHGVKVPEFIRFSGELARGVVVVNNLMTRGRRLGADIFQQVRRDIPLDLIGMGSNLLGGIGEFPQQKLLALASHYRFFFNPIRYTSMGLAVCEAMTIGMPIIGLATTEMATAIQNGVSGYVDTRVDKLIAHMHELQAHPTIAHRLGDGARRYAQERFGIERFVRDWISAFALVTDNSPASSTMRLRRGRAS